MDINQFLLLNNEFKLTLIAYALPPKKSLDEQVWSSWNEIRSRFDNLELEWEVKKTALKSLLATLKKFGFIQGVKGKYLRKKSPELSEHFYYTITPEFRFIQQINRYLLVQAVELGTSIYPVIGQTSPSEKKKPNNANRLLVFEALSKRATQKDLRKFSRSSSAIANHLDVLLKNNWLFEPSPLKHGDSKRYKIVEAKREELKSYLTRTTYKEFEKIFKTKSFTKNDVAAVMHCTKASAKQFVRILREKKLIYQVNVWRKGATFSLTTDGRKVYRRIVKPIQRYFRGKIDDSYFSTELENHEQTIKAALDNYRPFMQHEASDSRKIKLLRLIETHGWLSQRRIFDLTDISYPTVGGYLRQMKEARLIKPVDKEKLYKYYGLTKKGRLAAKGTIKI